MQVCMEFFIYLQVCCDMVSDDEAWLSSLGFQTVTLNAGWMTQETGGMTVLKLQEKPLTRHTTQTWYHQRSGWSVAESLRSHAMMTLDTLFYCKPQRTVRVGRHSAPKLLAMATSETVQSGLRVSALKNAKLNMEDNTWQLRALDRLHAVVTCKVLMRSASGVTRAGVVLWSWLEEVELVDQVPITELGQRWRNLPLLKSKKITEENLTLVTTHGVR